jgi:hypothetical protein
MKSRKRAYGSSRESHDYRFFERLESIEWHLKRATNALREGGCSSAMESFIGATRSEAMAVEETLGMEHGKAFAEERLLKPQAKVQKFKRALIKKCFR